MFCKCMAGLPSSVCPQPLLIEALGKQKEQYVVAAQSKTKKAHVASRAAAFNLFKTQLEEDTAKFEAMKVRQVSRNKPLGLELGVVRPAFVNLPSHIL